MNKPTTIYIVRHGEAEENLGKLDNLHPELGSPLTPKGITQAKKLAKQLADIEFNAIFSSDLTRTVQTATIIGSKLKLPIKTSKQIRERSFHHYIKNFTDKSETQIKQELVKDLQKLNELEKLNYKHSKLMESVTEGAVRLLSFINESIANASGKNILIVAHGNIMRSLLNYLGYAKFDELPAGSLENTGYFVLEENDSNYIIKNTVGVNKQKNTIRNF